MKLYKASSFLPWAPYLPLLLCSLGTQEFGQKGSTDARKTQKYANGQIRKYTKVQIKRADRYKETRIPGRHTNICKYTKITDMKKKQN